MHSQLERPITPHFINTEQYLRMIDAAVFDEDESVELMEGLLVSMSPTGSRHAGFLGFLQQLLIQQLADDFFINSQNPLLLEDGSVPEPDILILQQRADFYTLSHPRAEDAVLLIEIADSSLEYDTSYKSLLYARNAIPEYWVIELAHKQISVYRRASLQGYQSKEVYTQGSISLPNQRQLSIEKLLRIL